MTKTIAIDIGHGSDTFPPSKGIYKGGKGYAEHDFNSKLAIEVEKQLKSCGFNVILYQKPYSKDIPLIQRTNYYNAKKVDLVYSLHANYNKSSDVNGRCVFYWHTAKDSKRLAEIVADEIKKAGYSTHGNGLHASQVGSWTDLHICRETNMTAVLVENGFMSGNKDFDLVFGAKQSKYIEDMAKVHAKAICRYYGVKYDSTPKPKKPAAPSKPKTSGKSIDQLADEVIAGKHGSGNARKKALGAQYAAVQKRVNEKLGAKPKSAGKSVATLVEETLAGKHGNGEARKKSLGKNYKAVQDIINGKSSAPKPKTKSIDQMATEVIRGDHGDGHEARRKSLGISKAEYEKVRKEVNRRL